jgi:hypothetical protein
MRTLLCGTIVCLLTVAVHGAGIGKVTVTAEQAPIMQGNETILTAKKGDTFDVTELKGDWFGVAPSRGWIHKTNVRYDPSTPAAVPPPAKIEPAPATAVPPAAEPAVPKWMDIPPKELATEMSILLSITNNPNANTMVKITLMLTATGSVKRQGTRVYQAEQTGIIVLWSSADSVEKGKYFPFSWRRDWLKGKEIKDQNPIEDSSNFSLVKKDESVIKFIDSRVLSSCSNVLSFRDGDTVRRFVVVDYGFELTKTDADIASQKRTYASRKRVFWPYDKVFLSKITEGKKVGDALYEAAQALLGQIEYEEKPQVAAATDTKDAGKQKAQQLFGNGLEKGRRTFTWIDNPKAILEGTVHVVDGKTRFLEWLVGKESVVFDVESSAFYDQRDGNLLAELQTGKKATVTVDGRPLQALVRLFKFKEDKSERAKAVYSSLGISLEGTAMVYQDGKLVYAAYKCGGKWFICEMKSATAKDAVREGDLQEDSGR